MTNPEEVEKSMMESEKTAIAGQLSACIAHEIRNPLTSLKGFLQLLQGGVEQKEVYYKIMADEIDKIEVMASELLFISKPFTENRQVESIQSRSEEHTSELHSHGHHVFRLILDNKNTIQQY